MEPVIRTSNERFQEQVRILRQAKRKLLNEDATAPDAMQVMNQAYTLLRMVGSGEKKINALVEEREKLKGQLDEVLVENKKLKAQNDEVHMEIALKGYEKLIDDTIIASVSAIIVDNKKLKTQNDEMINELSSRLDDLSERNAILKSEIDNLTCERDELQTAVEELTSERDDLTSERDELRGRC